MWIRNAPHLKQHLKSLLKMSSPDEGTEIPDIEKICQLKISGETFLK